MMGIAPIFFWFAQSACVPSSHGAPVGVTGRQAGCEAAFGKKGGDAGGLGLPRY
ncbi:MULTISPECIES: hypothetical protein [Cupriavidus]|uniref:hypothetical protein n=1 Tax=Cupriavidus TaxID=106589 RepID=UPI0003A680BC|nr:MULTISPECIES: hypothetical protein [Cupriavidus]